MTILNLYSKKFMLMIMIIYHVCKINCTFESGEIFFVEDVHGKGHFSKSGENKTRRSVFITVPDSFPENSVGVTRNYNPEKK